MVHAARSLLSRLKIMNCDGHKNRAIGVTRNLCSLLRLTSLTIAFIDSTSGKSLSAGRQKREIQQFASFSNRCYSAGLGQVLWPLLAGSEPLSASSKIAEGKCCARNKS